MVFMSQVSFTRPPLPGSLKHTHAVELQCPAQRPGLREPDEFSLPQDAVWRYGPQHQDRHAPLPR